MLSQNCVDCLWAWFSLKGRGFPLLLFANIHLHAEKWWFILKKQIYHEATFMSWTGCMFCKAFRCFDQIATLTYVHMDVFWPYLLKDISGGIQKKKTTKKRKSSTTIFHLFLSKVRWLYFASGLSNWVFWSIVYIFT